jgi:hypothetical protein
MYLNSHDRIAEFDADMFGAMPDPRLMLTGGSAKGTLVAAAASYGGSNTLTSGATGVFADDLTIVNLGVINFIVHNPLGVPCLSMHFAPNSISNLYIFAGFTDTTAAEAPIYAAGGGTDNLVSDASNAVGFMFDTDMLTDVWHLVGVENDVDATRQSVGAAPTANGWEQLDIFLTLDGRAQFYRNGAIVGTMMSDAVGSNGAAAMTPVLAISKRSGASSFALSIDRINAKQTRGF